MVADMIKAIEVPEDFEEKPRILALMCENDAVPALDAAAANGATWNPWVRVIPIRCLGSTNIIWIAEALSRGVDGVILIGCKYGDDYQCHYIRGSELANTRLDNVGETLTRLALEPERIKMVELSHDEFDRVPLLLDEFAAELDGSDPTR
jgi:quinone-modifying oxidoreductase subunit QmoB